MQTHTHTRLRRAVLRLALAVTTASTAALLGACVGVPAPTSAMLTYETSPEGATLFEGGQNIGVAPVTRTYASDGKSPTIRTPEVTAVWPSGAKESYYTLLPPGADRKATIERPAGAKNLQADLDHAKGYIAARIAAEQKQQQAVAREAARGSARCKEQTARGGAKAGVDDCS